MQNKTYRILYYRVEPTVTLYCLQYADDRHVAQDLVQETFLRYLLTKDDFKGKCCYQTWIISIAKNVCKNYIAQKKYQKRDTEVFYLSEYQDNLNDIVDIYAESPLEILINKERQILFENAILTLPDEQGTAFKLRVIDQLKYSDIAEIMGKKIPTVRKMVQRGKDKILENKNIY
jgi:RNA polymerase sigma-70 factor (ECF subfamily)